MNILIAPFLNALFGFYYLFGNLGWAIIVVTVLIRVLLLPLLLPSLKSSGKMRELQPKLKKLQDKYKGNKEKLAKAQMDLYKNEGINPMSGCLPQLLQVAVLFVFFGAFRMVTDYVQGNGADLAKINSNLIANFRIEEGFEFNATFFGADLAMSPGQLFKNGVGISLLVPAILLLGSAILQFLSAKRMMPNPKIDEKVVKKTEDKEDDMAVAMRNQSTYMMPLMTVFLGWNFSLGILLYWFVNSAVILGTQVVVNKGKEKK